MAEMNTNWQQVTRTDGVQEHFFLGEFIQSDKWSGSRPPKFKQLNYPYEKDCFEHSECKHPFDHEIHVTNIIHATSSESMLSIIKDGGFKANEKQYPGICPMSLVWFGLKIEEEEIERMTINTKSSIQSVIENYPALDGDCVNEVLSQIARSPVFMPMSRYGNFKFTFCIKDLLENYTNQFCVNSTPPDMRKLGTFAYKQEIMHVILVCPSNTPGTDICPILSDDPVIKPDATLETWTWKPHSTGHEYIHFHDSGYPWRVRMRWEHVTFAFYVPNDRCLQIPYLDHHVSLCIETSIRHGISDVNMGIKMVLSLIESIEADKKKSLADTLIRMIAGYLSEERFYVKMMEDWDKYGQIDLVQVVQNLQIFLPSLEFSELDWFPFRIWVASLTRHSNVLYAIQKANIRL